MTSIHIGLITLVVLVLVSGSYAFRCYECPPAGDCLVNYIATDCDEGIRSCYRVHMQYTVLRGCGSSSAATPHQNTEICNHELCNGSGRLTTGVSLVAIISLFLAKHFISY